MDMNLGLLGSVLSNICSGDNSIWMFPSFVLRLNVFSDAMGVHIFIYIAIYLLGSSLYLGLQLQIYIFL